MSDEHLQCCEAVMFGVVSRYSTLSDESQWKTLRKSRKEKYRMNEKLNSSRNIVIAMHISITVSFILSCRRSTSLSLKSPRKVTFTSFPMQSITLSAKLPRTTSRVLFVVKRTMVG